MLLFISQEEEMSITQDMINEHIEIRSELNKRKLKGQREKLIVKKTQQMEEGEEEEKSHKDDLILPEEDVRDSYRSKRTHGEL